MYSLVYGIVVGAGSLVLAQVIDGRVAIGIGLVLLGLRWWHLGARASFERQAFGASMAELKRAKEEFERQHPGVPYVPPSFEDLRARRK